MHICVGVLWTSVFLWRFYDNKTAVTISNNIVTLLYIRISFSDKLGLNFAVSLQFTSNFIKLQVLHIIINPPDRTWLPIWNVNGMCLNPTLLHREKTSNVTWAVLWVFFFSFFFRNRDGSFQIFTEIQICFYLEKKNISVLLCLALSVRRKNVVQWNLFITRSLGPWKLPCYNRFLIISG